MMLAWWQWQSVQNRGERAAPRHRPTPVEQPQTPIQSSYMYNVYHIGCNEPWRLPRLCDCQVSLQSVHCLHAPCSCLAWMPRVLVLLGCHFRSRKLAHCLEGNRERERERERANQEADEETFGISEYGIYSELHFRIWHIFGIAFPRGASAR